MQFLESSQYWPAAQLSRYVNERLRCFLQLATAQVPFYREIFQQLPTRLESPADFTSLPFLERRHLQDHFSALKNQRYQGTIKTQATGGSSGAPVHFAVDTVRETNTIAMRLRSHRWHGVDVGDPEIVVWGSSIETGRQDFLRTLRDFLFRSKLVYAFNFSEEIMHQTVQEILHFKPRQIFGYAQSLHLLAKYYLEHFSPQLCRLCDVVFATAEPLFDYQREDIERAFGARIAVEYGARDAGLIAHECPHGNMHINAEGIYVEIIDVKGRVLPSGKIGEIVVTNFDTPSMPIIRYRTGDMGMRLDEVCPCGVTLPMMKVVGGRLSDFLVGADGRKIHPLGGIYILRDIEAIRRFRIVQNAWDQIDLFISASQKLSENTQNSIQRKFVKLLGGPVRLSFQYIDDIETSSSGKFRHVICKVMTSCLQ